MKKTKHVALVTGANRGIGKEVARQLSQNHGFQVFLGSRDLNRGQIAASAIGKNCLAVKLDVADADSVQGAIAEIAAIAGRLDVLINNAGVDYDTDQKPSTADLDRVRRAFDTNLFGAWAAIQAAIPLLRESNAGRIVNVSSGAGSLSGMSAGTPGYGISKAALNALTLKTAVELRPAGILVNAVCPGWVATDMGGGGQHVSEGAKSVVWAATLPNAGPTGGFFRDGNPIEW